ncbi:MAG TPA: HigA family addiction module antitoxin [Acidobacteriaceae bacterium]
MALIAIHPGEQLQEELVALSMSAAELARQIEVPANRISQILKADRDISADTAIRLGHFFGTSAQFWLNLQSIYDLRIAERQIGRFIKALPTLKSIHAHAPV